MPQFSKNMGKETKEGKIHTLRVGGDFVCQKAVMKNGKIECIEKSVQVYHLTDEQRIQAKIELEEEMIDA